jgi:hypothetical protein
MSDQKSHPQARLLKRRMLLKRAVGLSSLPLLDATAEPETCRRPAQAGRPFGLPARGQERRNHQWVRRSKWRSPWTRKPRPRAMARA